jgi:predicted transcriptional regulator of viral defense system
MVRTIPKYLASIVEQLELEQTELLTIKDIQRYADSVGSTIQATRIAFELRNRGWLLPTSARGVYEFSPGANAGAYSKGGKLSNVKAVALANPEIIWFYSHQSALYFHKIVDQTPDNPQITIKCNSIKNVPYAFTKLTHNVFDAQLEPVIINGNPVEQLETLLVHICAKPRSVSDWFVYEENIRDIWDECDIRKLHQELDKQSSNTRNRLKKLLRPIKNEVQLDI